MSSLPTGLVSHTRKVQSLYKRALRSLENWYHPRHIFRYEAVLMRARFESNRCIENQDTAKEVLFKGERELFEKQHWNPRKFMQSPGGTAYQRVVTPPDWVLDYWHPLEKAQYPEYFARREERKKEYVKFWMEQYSKSDASKP